VSIKDRMEEVRKPDFNTMYGRLGPLASRIAHVLLGGVRGDHLRIEDLEVAVGSKISTTEKTGRKAYGKLVKAARYVREEKQIHWEWQRGERLLVCHTSDGAVRCLERNREQIHRKTRKGLSIGTCVVRDDLTEDRRRTHDSLMLGHHLADMASAPSMVKLLVDKEPEKLKAPEKSEALMKVLDAALPPKT
jgi:hypothetical protein